MWLFPEDANQDRYSVPLHSREFTVGSLELTEFEVFNQIFFSFVLPNLYSAFLYTSFSALFWATCISAGTVDATKK